MSRILILKPEQELRLEVDNKEVVKIQLVEGLAEIFGCELASNFSYAFQNTKLAIFSWQGCKIGISGTPSVEYIVSDTPMSVYLNCHFSLQQKRSNAQDNDLVGPRVIIVGPPDVGKTSLSKILLNYAVKQSSKTLFIDIDTNEGSLSLPNTLCAVSMTRPIDPEEDFGANPVSTNTTPIAFYYGYPSPLEKQKLYTLLLDQLASIVHQKIDIDPSSKHSGMVINTPSQFVEGAEGLELLKHAIDSFKINAILVIGHERLYSDLKRTYDQNPDMSILKLPKSGGVVTRDKAFRRTSQMQRIKSYFYGTPNTYLGRSDLNPYSLVVSFNDIHIRKIGQDVFVPMSALPLGTDRKMDETKLVNVEPGNILLHSVLALSNADVPDSMIGTEIESKLILESSICGFIYISAIDENRRKMTILSPAPGKLPKKYLLMASLKWIES